MAGLPFDRVIENLLERPLSLDWNQSEAALDRALRDVVGQLFAKRTFGNLTGAFRAGVIGSGFYVIPQSPVSLGVAILPGLGFAVDGVNDPSSINGINGLDDLSTYKPCLLSALQNLTLNTAPSAGNERYDIIEINPSVLLTGLGALTNPQSRDILNPTSGQFVPTTVSKTLSWDMLGDTSSVVSPAPSTAPIGVKAGVPAAVGTAVVPPTTTGYMAIAVIYVGPSATSIPSQNYIKDVRQLLYPSGVLPFGFSFMPGTVGSGPVTNATIDVPPGVPACIVANDLNVGGTIRSVDCYLFPGQGPAGVSAVHAAALLHTAFLTPGAANSTPSANVTVPIASVSVGTVTATLAAQIDGANALPAFLVAARTSSSPPYQWVSVLGQPYVCISVLPGYSSPGSWNWLPSNDQTSITGLISL